MIMGRMFSWKHSTRGRAAYRIWHVISNSESFSSSSRSGVFSCVMGWVWIA